MRETRKALPTRRASFLLAISWNESYFVDAATAIWNPP